MTNDKIDAMFSRFMTAAKGDADLVERCIAKLIPSSPDGIKPDEVLELIQGD
jgi:hypothetical protein